MTRALALAATLLVFGCDSGGDATGVTGTWEGEVFALADGAPRYPATLRLSDAGTTVTGTGVVELPGSDVFNFTVVDGRFADGAVSLDLRFDQTPFSGTVNGQVSSGDPATISGTFQGGGLVGDSRIEVELVDR